MNSQLSCQNPALAHIGFFIWDDIVFLESIVAGPVMRIPQFLDVVKITPLANFHNFKVGRFEQHRKTHRIVAVEMNRCHMRNIQGGYRSEHIASRFNNLVNLFNRFKGIVQMFDGLIEEKKSNSSLKWVERVCKSYSG